MSFNGHERVYLPGGKVAHISANDGHTVSQCRLWEPAGFYGTGSQDEYEIAEQRPTCKVCAKKIGEQS